MPWITSAPFTAEQQAHIQAWQNCPWVHPLTCGGCSSKEPLLVKPEGIACPHCGYLQTHVPAVCLGDLPPSPAELFGLDKGVGMEPAWSHASIAIVLFGLLVWAALAYVAWNRG